MPRAVLTAVVVLAAAAGVAPAALAPGVTSTPAADGGSAGSIVTGPDGGVWYTDFNTRSVGRVAPCPSGNCAVTQSPMGLNDISPYRIAVGPDGALWVTSAETLKLVRIAPCASGSCPLTATKLADQPASSTDGPAGITAGPDGALWVTGPNHIVWRVEACDHDDCPLTTTSTGTDDPYGITTGPDGAVWYGASQGIGRIAPCATGNCAITRTPLPYVPQNGAQTIVAGPDGGLWFDEGERNMIGRITPCAVGNCPITETGMSFNPGTNGTRGTAVGLAGLTPGPDDKIWFSEGRAARIGRLTPCKAGNCPIAETAPMKGLIPGGIAAGPDSAVWFTSYYLSGEIDRVALDAPMTGVATLALPATATISRKTGKGVLKARCRRPASDRCAVKAEVLIATKKRGKLTGTIRGGRSGTLKLTMVPAGRKGGLAQLDGSVTGKVKATLAGSMTVKAR